MLAKYTKNKNPYFQISGIGDIPNYFLGFGKHVGDTTLTNDHSAYISLNAMIGNWRKYKVN